MYTAQDIRDECCRLDKLCGVNTQEIEIKLNNAKSKLGSFSLQPAPSKYALIRALSPAPHMVITISRQVMSDENLFYDTVRHEYAHALVYLRKPNERHAHDAVWKAACREVGCTPRATVKNKAYSEQRRASAKYTVSCRGCGAESYYQKAGKTVSLLLTEPATKKIICRRCGGRSFELHVNK